MGMYRCSLTLHCSTKSMEHFDAHCTAVLLTSTAKTAYPSVWLPTVWVVIKSQTKYDIPVWPLCWNICHWVRISCRWGLLQVDNPQQLWWESHMQIYEQHCNWGTHWQIWDKVACVWTHLGWPCGPVGIGESTLVCSSLLETTDQYPWAMYVACSWVSVTMKLMRNGPITWCLSRGLSWLW